MSLAAGEEVVQQSALLSGRRSEEDLGLEIQCARLNFR